MLEYTLGGEAQTWRAGMASINVFYVDGSKELTETTPTFVAVQITDEAAPLAQTAGEEVVS